MEDKAGEVKPRAALELQNGIKNVVQTIGFAGGPWTGADNFMNVRKTRANFVDIALCIRVVRISADKNMIVLVVQRTGGKARHVTDNAGFIPGGNHNCQRLFLRLIKGFIVQTIVAAVYRDRAPYAANPIDDINK
ncbi:hypothetical protein D3C75_680740 [compost metagenome]